MHGRARNFEERDLREALVLAEGDFRARTCVSPESRKLETTRTLRFQATRTANQQDVIFNSTRVSPGDPLLTQEPLDFRYDWISN